MYSPRLKQKVPIQIFFKKLSKKSIVYLRINLFQFQFNTNY